jgi:hypothetical protein
MPRSALGAVVLLLACLLFGHGALAAPGRTAPEPKRGATRSGEDDSDDRAAAMSLFKTARRLMSEGHFRQACSMFEASYELVPGVGTQYNLAECYEKVGKLASAWINFLEVAQRTAEMEDHKRSEAATARANGIEPRLTRVVIKVEAPVDGMTLTFAGKPVPEGQWGIAVPRDPGTYQIEATATSYREHRRTVTVPQAPGKTVTIRVPALDRLPDVTAPPDPERPPSDPGSSATTAGWALLGVTAAFALVGGVLFAVGDGKKTDAEAQCPEIEACPDDPSRELHIEAQNLERASIAFFALGGTALVTSALLLAVGYSTPSPRGGVKLTPQVAVGALGATLDVRW